ncbi:hypothetical protein JTB14_007121 [Gonioctena quinquepunctata]|nr:hypothetical protein JTB14_007121 [Gonioctena quinquepunctata]
MLVEDSKGQQGHLYGIRDHLYGIGNHLHGIGDHLHEIGDHRWQELETTKFRNKWGVRRWDHHLQVLFQNGDRNRDFPHQSDIEEWEKWLQKVRSFFGSSRDRKPRRKLQRSNDENCQPNQKYGKDSAESIEGKIEEIVVTEIQTGTGKEDAGKQIEGKDSVPEPVEQEIEENKDLVEPSLEMISTEKQPRDPKEETDIVLEEDIIIPARTEALVNAKLRTKIEEELVICEPVDIGNGYVLAAICLIVNSTKVWIRVVNVSQKEVELMKKQKLAKAVSCGTMEEIMVTTNRMIGKIELDDQEWSKREFSLPRSAPVVLVTKKLPNGEEKVRMCIDYRGLNNVTKMEYYPLPNISDPNQEYNSGSEALFSAIDVAEAYHQIDMEEKDIPL